MLLKIKNLLTDEKIEEIKSIAMAGEFIDGKKNSTTNKYHDEIKNNLELVDTKIINQIYKLLTEYLKQNDTFIMAARPFKYSKPVIARYSDGMEYKKHVDKTHIGGELPYFVRSDVTVMIWLTNPSEYEGGHFSLEDSTAHTRYKLNSGDAVIYPSNIPNAIEPVTSGENLIISTWIQSHISDPIDREILFDLETVSQRLYKSEGKTNLHDILFKAFQNLLRQKVGF